MLRFHTSRVHASPRFVTPVLAVLVALVAYLNPSAQSPAKKAMTVDDYTKWKSITDPAIPGDGKWVTYVLQTTNVPTEQAKPMLHVLNLETDADVAYRMRRAASSPPIRSGSRIRSIRRPAGAAVAVAVVEARRRLLRRPRTPRSRLELLRPRRPRRLLRRPHRRRHRRRRSHPQLPAQRPHLRHRHSLRRPRERTRRAVRPRRLRVAEAPRRRRLRAEWSCATSRRERRSRSRTSRRSCSLRLHAAGAEATASRRRRRWRTHGERGGQHTSRRRRTGIERSHLWTARDGRDSARPPHRTPSAARQRRRHRLQQEGHATRLHRGRRGQGREWPVRLRRPARTRDAARQRQPRLQPSRLERGRDGAGRAEGRRGGEAAGARQRPHGVC